MRLAVSPVSSASTKPHPVEAEAKPYIVIQGYERLTMGVQRVW